MTVWPRCTVCGRALRWRLILGGPGGRWTHHRQLPPSATPHAAVVPDDAVAPERRRSRR